VRTDQIQRASRDEVRRIDWGILPPEDLAAESIQRQFHDITGGTRMGTGTGARVKAARAVGGSKPSADDLRARARAEFLPVFDFDDSPKRWRVASPVERLRLLGVAASRRASGRWGGVSDTSKDEAAQAARCAVIAALSGPVGRCAAEQHITPDASGVLGLRLQAASWPWLFLLAVRAANSCLRGEAFTGLTGDTSGLVFCRVESLDGVAVAALVAPQTRRKGRATRAMRLRASILGRAAVIAGERQAIGLAARQAAQVRHASRRIARGLVLIALGESEEVAAQACGLKFDGQRGECSALRKAVRKLPALRASVTGDLADLPSVKLALPVAKASTPTPMPTGNGKVRRIITRRKVRVSTVAESLTIYSAHNPALAARLLVGFRKVEKVITRRDHVLVAFR